MQIGGREHTLGPDKGQAFKLYHKLMLRPPELLQDPRAEADTVVAVIDLFLDWCKVHRDERTYDWYRAHLQRFADAIPATLPVVKLKPFHVLQWTDSHKDWAPGMKRGAITAVQRSLNWAVKVGHIDRSPIAHVEKPPAGKRELVVTPEAYQKMLELCPEEPYRDLLTLAWETGARPQELLAMEARHFEPERRRVIFAASEAKGKRDIRVVHLTDTALAIVARLAERHPKGLLLRNTDGVPWTPQAASCLFGRLKKKLGGVKYCLYAFRHGFCHRAIKNGVDPVTVANLMGHRDTAMVARVYSNLGQDQSYLANAMRRAAGAA